MAGKFSQFISANAIAIKLQMLYISDNRGNSAQSNSVYISECHSHSIQIYSQFCKIHKQFFFLQWASSSVYHLLGMWSRLVASVSYLKGDSPSLLDEFVPKITEGFIISRFDSVQVYNTADFGRFPMLNCIFSLICYCFPLSRLMSPMILLSILWIKLKFCRMSWIAFHTCADFRLSFYFICVAYDTLVSLTQFVG